MTRNAHPIFYVKTDGGIWMRCAKKPSENETSEGNIRMKCKESTPLSYGKTDGDILASDKEKPPNSNETSEGNIWMQNAKAPLFVLRKD